ncbi:MAG: hypothetical protein JOZ24_01620, partial [Candidatus Eremiobacteraeota bacterium]|nr:hypothetical protein [Candidatus Eremiobacteraeota bacterium]
MGLLLPLGAGPAAAQIEKGAAALAAPSKQVTLAHDGIIETLATKAATADELL